MRPVRLAAFARRVQRDPRTLLSELQTLGYRHKTSFVYRSGKRGLWLVDECLLKKVVPDWFEPEDVTRVLVSRLEDVELRLLRIEAYFGGAQGLID